MIDKKNNNQHSEVKRWWNYSRNLRWDTFYDDSNPDRHHVIHRQAKTMEQVELLGLPKGAKILELGYGAGQTAKLLLEKGYEYHGIDISDELCKKSIERCQVYVDQGMAKFSVGNIEAKSSYEDEFFDAVIVCGALQYLDDINKCFIEVNRVLKPKSSFVVCQTNMYALKDMIFPRRLILRILYALSGQKIEVFPSFRAMLVETSALKNSFGKYESTLKKYSFFTKGDETHSFYFKKRLNSFWRLRKLFHANSFIIERNVGATFFHPPGNIFRGPVTMVNNILQFISDHILKFISVYADNVIISGRKK
ncbi:MAG: class I SAM-dependent methyltransferase [Gammaproteobacteria bacterium]|jgi:ubiquinone/menaquinone biosynthesis C-methylase UbiE|nr:class I SAM-dependent methyltransferase [Gammaproteobacteria bacterium]MBT4462027.1 class I SAM-dependent methyltransferase [Gammaproteobacteria bacterium]MBT4654539.1 class I SAM-dependent methyltransferase [Gammaproteobacteria bacterium]MBT5117151.1 class I SAM-dependent methyltransferase [Gammaproteobacteria bacterium]MBT5761480.1 class I SAM-dependent methyltransferase [Gammaproteobacteria bacterium]